MSVEPVRVGLIGAGANTKARHIPGFRAIPGVEIVGVANRSAASSSAVASQFSIPKTYPSYQDLLADPEITAVCIGTWPNMHAEITLAALAAGKHVLCEARMARNLTEARAMLAASEQHPHLVAQLVPSPFGLAVHDLMHELVRGRFVNDLREMVVVSANDQFLDDSEVLHWRQDHQISGVNTLALGIVNETVSRWVPETKWVFAHAKTFSTPRPSPHGPGFIQATVPDVMHVVAELEGGIPAMYHCSGVELFGPGIQVHLYGRSGTIKLQLSPKEELLCGRIGDAKLVPVNLPVDATSGWRVEAEFVGAIRKTETVRFTDFATGVRYMQFTQAVWNSSLSHAPVSLPLA